MSDSRKRTAEAAGLVEDSNDHASKNAKIPPKEPHELARRQVVGLAKHQYPSFTHGRHLCQFAMAMRDKSIDATAITASRSWLSRYFADEVGKAAYDGLEDWTGVLVAAVLLEMDNEATRADDADKRNDITFAVQFIAYRATNKILIASSKDVEACLEGKASPECLEKVKQAWASCKSLRDILIQNIQDITINAALDAQVQLDTCKWLWREVRNRIRNGEAMCHVFKASESLQPSRFKERFASVCTQMERSDCVLSTNTRRGFVQAGAAFPVPSTSTFQETPSHFDDHSGDEMYWYESLREDLEICVEERAAFEKHAKNLLQRLSFMAQCNADRASDGAAVAVGMLEAL
ncbi:hypothetical protein EJ05DRAFT_495767 [Pseudovirgaria hyperparasitica]|uniref:Uncharacterized protein n=1 Tax=Pseudovirgaria hyperparasitica TaxID=470096 RepID=A0A6A6WL54_9PEZI|nr:uncharacterized protein EJ05DRAFT_495767 [Pseudovirgaria hyperparasitica]KAF2762917.1 hypothetical protein EJ05DRAFT_495767 [Pseudovirgaria hyperparasitica]